MKKTNDLAELKEYICDTFHESDDLLQKYELEGYISSDNQPDIKAMERSDDLTVKEVLIIGTHMALRKAHQLVHEEEAKQLEVQFRQMMSGDKSVKDVAPKDLPDEVVDAMQEIVDMVREMKKSNKKGKK